MGMPNRIIKESICYSEDINNLSAVEEIFFYRLIVNCDDYGRMDARLPILKAKLYPLREKMKPNDIKKILLKLCNTKPEPLVILYEVNKIPYIQMTKWAKHQQIRACRSKYPSLEEVKSDEIQHLITSDINGNQLIANVPVIQSNPIQSESESESIYSGINPPTNKFSVPLLEEVKKYCVERNNKVDPEKWINHYTSNGWMVGKVKMKDWKAAVRTWEKTDQDKPQQKYPQQKPINMQNTQQRKYTKEDIDKLYEDV